MNAKNQNFMDNFNRIVMCPKCGKQERARTIGNHKRWCGDDPVARFWSKVQKGPGCWNWTGAKHRDGYGRGRIGGRDKIGIAHRIAYKLAKGDIPDGMDVCHTCDNRLCCNPDHLWLGTHDDNMADKLRKGRVLRGSQSVRAKLNEAQAQEILRHKPTVRRIRGLAKSIAAKYGVGIGAVYDIWRGDAWTHIRNL